MRRFVSRSSRFTSSSRRASIASRIDVPVTSRNLRSARLRETCRRATTSDAVIPSSACRSMNSFVRCTSAAGVFIADVEARNTTSLTPHRIVLFAGMRCRSIIACNSRAAMYPSRSKSTATLERAGTDISHIGSSFPMPRTDISPGTSIPYARQVSRTSCARSSNAASTAAGFSRPRSHFPRASRESPGSLYVARMFFF